MMPTMEIIRREVARAGLRLLAQIEAINVSLLKLPPKPVEHTPLGPSVRSPITSTATPVSAAAAKQQH